MKAPYLLKVESGSKSEMDLITRRVIQEQEGGEVSAEVLKEYSDPCSDRYANMIEEIRRIQNFTSLRYHRLDDRSFRGYLRYRTYKDSYPFRSDYQRENNHSSTLKKSSTGLTDLFFPYFSPLVSNRFYISHIFIYQ